jgi:hypothetical protein
MLKKEWRDIFLPVLLRLLIGPVLAVFYSILDGQVNEVSALLFFFGYAVSLLWVALYLGLNAFHCEFRDKAFEYILTFPIRRGHMLAVKLIVRLVFLGVLLGLYCLFLVYLQNTLSIPKSLIQSPLFRAQSFSFLALSYLSIGFFLSLFDWGSARPAVPWLILAGHGLLAFSLEKSLGYSATEWSSLLLTAATGGFFFYSFQKLRRGTLGHWLQRGSKRFRQQTVQRKNGRSWGVLRHELPVVFRSFIFTTLFFAILAFIGRNVRLSFFGGQEGLPDPVLLVAVAAFFLVVFFAYHSASGLFFAEFRYKALEYLLTFPVSFRRIVIEKLLARAIIIAPFLIGYMVFAGHFSERLVTESGSFYVFLRPAFLPFWVALMFFNGFFLSLFEMKNSIALVSLANLYTIVLVPLAFLRIVKNSVVAANGQVITAIIIGSGLLLTTLVLAAFFLKILPRFDLAAPKRFSAVFGWSLFFIFTALSLTSLGIVLFV